ncbi:MAG: adaptor protein MecA [Ruminococcus sp.]|nr:adaptor protein MecA [Ruminococcus sp.]
MKIEKLNENQIRCTLTHADLAARQLKLSELAYGSEKAKALFRDMMQQASFDFGFEADDIPLMIEAIPTSPDSIVLIITKVEDPEELDTRFSRFTSSDDVHASLPEPLAKLEGADEFMNLLNKVKKAVAGTSAPDAAAPAANEPAPAPFQVKLFSFENIDGAIKAAELISAYFHGASTLYRDPENGMYILAISQADHTNNEFNKVCNMLSEYGSQEKTSAPVLAFLEEHCETIISDDSIQKLASIL